MSENRAEMSVGMTGLISLLSIFGHFGIKLNQKDFLKENEASQKDITIKQIMAISKKKTLRAEHLRPTADELREIELPVKLTEYSVTTIAGEGRIEPAGKRRIHSRAGLGLRFLRRSPVRSDAGLL